MSVDWTKTKREERCFERMTGAFKKKNKIDQS